MQFHRRSIARLTSRNAGHHASRARRSTHRLDFDDFKGAWTPLTIPDLYPFVLPEPALAIRFVHNLVGKVAG
jgi:hypothetical protein